MARKRNFIQTRRQYHHKRNRHTVDTRYRPHNRQDVADIELYDPEVCARENAERKNRAKVDRLLDLF